MNNKGFINLSKENRNDNDNEIYPQRQAENSQSYPGGVMNDDGEIYPNRQFNASSLGNPPQGSPYGYQSNNYSAETGPYQAQQVFQQRSVHLPQQQYQQQYQQPQYQQPQYQQQQYQSKTKFCKYCGGVIPEDAVICTHCGRQVEELRQAQQNQQIYINNANNNSNQNYYSQNMGRRKDKTVSIILCLLFGWAGAHRFYEGKIGTGILYLCTGGLFFVGALIDFLVLLTKPDPYYV